MGLRARVHQFVEVAPPGSPLSRAFDYFILGLILVNVAAAIAGTDADVRAAVPELLDGIETFSLWVFIAEYVTRIWACTANPRWQRPLRGRLRYALQPMVMVDLIAILPFVLQLGGLDARMVRIVRLVRLLRIARLLRYGDAMAALARVLSNRLTELVSIAMVVFVLMLFAASLMHAVEHDAPGTPFTSIPAALWWAVVTLTTVGYGDVVPVTGLGRLLAGLVAILGIGMFALPTSVLGAAFVEELQEQRRVKEARRQHTAGGQCQACGRAF